VKSQSIPYPHLAARIFNTPLLVHPGKLDAIVAGIGPRLLGCDGVDISVDASSELFTTRKGKAAENRGYQVIDGVAVINVAGALVHRSQMSADSTFLLGYNTVASDLEDAMANSDVHSVAMVFDSPGGEVNGAFELADRIHEMRGQKPMIAIADSMAASAAYLIGSAADQMIVSGSGMVGSIGVVMRHVDWSRSMANEGVTVSHIYAGAHKVDGNPFEPLPASVRSEWQAEVDALYADFVSAVVRHRGITAEAVRGTEAAMYRAKDAIRVGLADRKATTDKIIAEMADSRPRRTYGPKAITERNEGDFTMRKEEQGAGLEVQPIVTFSQEDIDAARAEGEAAGRVAGAEAERERIKSVEAQSMAGHESLIAELKFDGKTTGPEAAAAVLAAHKASLAERREQMHEDAPPVIASAEEPAARVEVIDSRALAAAAQDLVNSERAAGRNITVAQAMKQLNQEA